MNRLRNIFLFIFWLTLFTNNCFAAPSNLQLTQEEERFIKEHPTLYLGVDPEFIPYEFIDTDGTYKGIAADYIKLISERTGLNLEVVEHLTWLEAYEKGTLKQLDVLPFVSRTAEREYYFLYSQPYYSFQRVIFIKNDNHTIHGLDDLMSRKVAVQTNSSHHGYLKDFKLLELMPYATVEEAIEAVSEGREESYVGNLATTTYLIKKKGITNLKYVNIESEEQEALYFAVRNDWPELVGIINKALADITEEERIAIDNRWIGVEKRSDYTEIRRIIGATASIIIIISIVSLYWILKLKREIEMRKQAEVALQIAKEEAELANQIKSIFLARMSHEIRTPLNAITGMAYIVKQTKLTTTQKEYLNKITRASNDMLLIINDILDFSKIEAGKIEAEHIPFNLDNVLESLMNIVAFKLEEQNIEFSMHRDPKVPEFFFGDPQRIQQVLLNIVNNAVKFTKDGTVGLTIRLISKIQDAYTIEFSIKDTGIGMSSDQLQHLFTPFAQGDSSISRRFGGTGLGLSIVKSLVEMMGGSIEAYSVLGEGSTFNVQLTLKADREQKNVEKKKGTCIYFQNLRVLVVEKSIFYTKALKDYLTSFNIQAEFVNSDARVIELIEHAIKYDEKPYDLLIVDYETPEHGGIAFCTKIKRLPFITDPPKFLLMIPLAQEYLFEKLEVEELDFGITKPIIPSLLYNAIIEIFKINLLETRDNSETIIKSEPLKVSYPYHLLVVEDNKTNQLIAESILESHGFRVTVQDNGREGYDFFLENQNDIDLILMDLHMPVLNGYEATSLIRKQDTQIPIIAMTADAITGVEEKCKSIGIDHYISKPFDPEQFIQIILYALKGAKEKNEQPVKEGRVILDVQDGIKHLGGKEEIYNMILKEYYNENKETQLILSQAIKMQDYKEAVQIVHKIKSSSGSIGAKELYEIASYFQKALQNESIEDILVLHKEFEEILKLLLLEINQRISQN